MAAAASQLMCAAAIAGPTLVWETKEGFAGPEAVLPGREQNNLYVSNVNGNPLKSNKKMTQILH